MQYVEYLEHNGEKFFVRDRVTLYEYGKPELTGIIGSFDNDEFTPKIHIIKDSGDLAFIHVKNIVNIRKTLPLNKTNTIKPEEYDKLGLVWELHRSTDKDSWDVCLDGVWYRLNMELDTSDRVDLLISIKENKLELQGIPFWNSCDGIKKSGLKKMVRFDTDTVYLLEYNGKN